MCPTKQTKTPVLKTRGGEQAEKKLEKVHSDITGLKMSVHHMGRIHAELCG